MAVFFILGGFFMLQLYHGSDTQFTHFKIFEDFKHGRDMGAGIYLTDSIERARAYGKLIYKVLILIIIVVLLVQILLLYQSKRLYF